MGSEKNSYNFKNDDIYEILNFVKEYHLHPTKTNQGRTNQGKRGFGGKLDAFLVGKLCEVGACRIIEGFSENKELYIDLDVYSNAEVGKRKDPDIVKVVNAQTKEERKPNLFVEVKKIDSNEQWLGARRDQIEKDLKNNTNGYMVHVSLDFEDDRNEKERDITASILKSIILNNRFDMSIFSDFVNLKAKIEYLYSYKDLKEKGFFFPSGIFMPNTNFNKMKRGVYLKSGDQSPQFELIHSYSGSYEIEMKQKNTIVGSYDVPFFKTWDIEGEFQIFKKIQTGNEYIYPIKRTIMSNDVIGNYVLDPKNTYEFHLENRLLGRDGRDGIKNVDEYSFSRKRLEGIQNEDEEFSLKNMISKVAKEI